MVRTADLLLSVAESFVTADWSRPAHEILAAAGLSVEPIDEHRGVARHERGMAGRYRVNNGHLVSLDVRFEDPRAFRMEELDDVVHDWFVSSFGPSQDSPERHHSHVRGHRWVHNSGLVVTLEVSPAPEPIVMWQLSRDLATADRLAAKRALARVGRLAPRCWETLADSLAGIGLTHSRDGSVSSPVAPTITGEWTPGHDLWISVTDADASFRELTVRGLVRTLEGAWGAIASDITDDDGSRELTWQVTSPEGTDLTVGMVHSPERSMILVYVETV